MAHPGKKSCWGIAFATSAALSFSLYLVWHAGEIHERIRQLIVDSQNQTTLMTREVEKSIGTEALRQRALLGALETDISFLIKQGAVFAQGDIEAARLAREAAPLPHGAQVDEDLADAEAGESAQEENLPPLPEVLSTRAMLSKLDLDSFFTNPAYNPDGKSLSRVEKMRAHNEVETAKAKIQILESRVQLQITEGIEMLREENAFLEYGPREMPKVEDGVITAGESLPGGGMRLFFFYPEEFPEIYTAREEMQSTSDLAIRRLLFIARS